MDLRQWTLSCEEQKKGSGDGWFWLFNADGPRIPDNESVTVIPISRYDSVVKTLDEQIERLKRERDFYKGSNGTAQTLVCPIHGTQSRQLGTYEPYYDVDEDTWRCQDMSPGSACEIRAAS